MPQPALNASSSEACAICLEPMRTCDPITVLRCRHTFHTSCICTSVYLHHNHCCPICRADIGPPHDPLQRVAVGRGVSPSPVIERAFYERDALQIHEGEDGYSYRDYHGGVDSDPDDNPQ